MNRLSSKKNTLMTTLLWAFCLFAFLGFSEKVNAAEVISDIKVAMDETAYVNGYLNRNEFHWYSFKTNADNAHYAVAITGSDVLGVDIYKNMNGPVLDSFNTIGSGGKEEIHYSKLEKNKTYYLRVHPFYTNSPSSYQMSLSEIKDEADDMETAESITINKAYNGSIRNRADVDYLRIKTGTTRSYYTVEGWTDRSSNWVNVALVDADGRVIQKISGAPEKGKSFSLILDANTVYYLKMTYYYSWYYEYNYGVKITKGADVKSAQTVTVSPLKKNISYQSLKKKDQKFTLKAKSKTKAKFAKTSGNSKIIVSSTGIVTVKKGLKKGSYSVKVKVTAPASSKYKEAKKNVTLKITVK